MSAYILAQLTIHDAERYRRYQAAFGATLEPFAGRLLVADTHPALLEGRWRGDKVVLIEFPDRDYADRWATSNAYRAIAGDRRASADATVLALRSVG